MVPPLVKRVNGKTLAAALVGGIVAWFAIFGYVLYDQHQRTDQNATALMALCAQRHDLDQRIASSEFLLEQYPSPIAFRRAVGIPRPLLEQSLRQNKATRTNLAILDCEAAEPTKGSP